VIIADTGFWIAILDLSRRTNDDIRKVVRNQLSWLCSVGQDSLRRDVQNFL